MPNKPPNRDKFAFDLRYDRARLKDQLTAIEVHRLSLQKQILPKDWQADLQHLFIVRSVHGTTAIEGNPLSEKEVDKQLTRTPKHDADQLERQTRNAYDAFRWVEKQFSKPNRRVNLDAIITLHRLLTTNSDQHDNTPGRIRESGHNVTVGSPQLGGVHKPPPGGSVLKRLVNEFVEFIHSRRFLEEHPVVQALIAHFYFVTLHQFGDGNGRATRCVEAAILYGAGYNTYGFYSLSNYFYRNRDHYFRLLQETRTKHKYDLTEFLLFGVRGFCEELGRIQAYVRNRTHRLHFRELIRRCEAKYEGKRRRLLNQREAAVLHGILDYTKPADPLSDEPMRETNFDALWDLCRTHYRGRTPRTMARELIRLEQLGFLSIRGEGPVRQWRFSIDLDAIGEY